MSERVRPQINQHEQLKPSEIGPAAKALFDATYEAIKSHPEAFDALIHTHLSPKIVYSFRVKEEKAHDQIFEIKVGDTRWEISGTLIDPNQNAVSGKKQELRLRKIDPTKHKTTYLEGYRVGYFTGHKTDPATPNTYYGSVVYEYPGGASMKFTRTILERSCKLLEEFSGEDTSVKSGSVRDKILSKWRNRKRLEAPQR